MGRVFISGSGVVACSAWLLGNLASPVNSRPNAFSMRAVSSDTTVRTVRPSSALSVHGSDVYRLPPCVTLPGCAGVLPPVACHSSSPSVSDITRIRSNVFCARRPSGATLANSSRVVGSLIAAMIRLAANSVFPLPRPTASKRFFVAGVSVFRPSTMRRLASSSIATMHCQGIHTSGVPAPASAPCPHRSANTRAASARASSHHTPCFAGARRSSR